MRLRANWVLKKSTLLLFLCRCRKCFLCLQRCTKYKTEGYKTVSADLDVHLDLDLDLDVELDLDLHVDQSHQQSLVDKPACLIVSLLFVKLNQNKTNTETWMWTRAISRAWSTETDRLVTQSSLAISGSSSDIT